MLSQLTSTSGPVTHDILDQLAPAGPARYLRQLLITQGVLPEHDWQLNLLERWFVNKLTEVTDPDERRILRSYLTWTHLRRLRRSSTPTSAYAASSIRGEVKSAVKLPAWLHERGRGLRTLPRPTSTSGACRPGGCHAGPANS